MKNVLKILILLSISFCYSQSGDRNEKIKQYQIKWTIKAEQNIHEGQIDKAFIAYSFVKNMDSLSEKGKIAHRIADSLKIIVRNELKSNIIGTWKWKNSGSNWGISETNNDSKKDKILIISQNSLSFYEINKLTNKKKLIKTEKLKFNNIAGMLPCFWELVYSDNQIWSFRLKKDGQILHLTNTGEVTENNSRTEIVCGNFELTYERIK
ncbi:hypothetical protein [Tenacibaculum sp. 190524A05c]|uniref:GLPGLI family protein n=1 Tax=Tenacibaculum platacis TaxID=3137852 RepID=A0ABP1EM51_9FLAO